MTEKMNKMFAFVAFAAIGAAGADVFTLEGPVRTKPFRQADFKWMVTPRHDYSKTYVTKLFLSQAEFDREYLGKFKMRDNGKQTVRMTCEQAFAAIKGMDAISLGLPKIVYLVGWQYNGHDSKYPAFFEGNREVARKCDKDPLDSIRWLMREAKKYHTAVSLHINLFDAYPDSPIFDEYVREDVLAKDKDGKLIIGDWAYKVNYAAEFEKGLLQKRVDRLCSILPVQKAGTIHVDAFHSSVPFPYVRSDGKVALKFLSPISPWHGGTPAKDVAAKKNIVKYFDSKGIDVTTEGVGGMDVGGTGEGWFPMYWHYGSREHALSLKASQACGGNVYGSQCAFGGNVNGEKLFMDNPDVAKALDVFKREFCKTVLICQYLNTFGRKELVEGKDGSIGVFEGGVRTMWKGGRLSVAKDGEVLCDGSDLFIPAVWLGNGAAVAYSEKGCRDRKWRIPSGMKLAPAVKAWTIDATGRTEFNKFTIDGNTVTITLSPNEMVLLSSHVPARGAMLDLQPQIDAAAARGGGTVCVPVGEHEVKPFELKSNVTLQLAFGARILASTNIADYATRGECPVFIYADHATNVAIVGKGTIDGRGGGFRETAKLRGEDQPKTLPLLMRFSRCRNVRLEYFHYTNPGSWACHLRNCDGVKVKGTSCFNYCNKMNDGLDIESCNVTVEDCDFYADDDSFCFKAESDKSFPVTNVVVRNCRMGSICNAIKFGTGSYNAFRDITIENCELRRSPGAWRWDWRKKGMPGVTNRYCGIAGLALEVVDGGRMENVTIRNIKMEGYMTPVFIRHSNRHGPKGKGNTYLRNILIENVTGTCDGRIASSITGVPARDGMPARRPSNITLRNISLVAPGGGTEKDATAQVPERDGAYPEAFMFNRMALPAYGFYVRHADDVRFENVKVDTATPDARPEFYMEDCSRGEMTAALRKRLLPDADKFLAYNAVLAEFAAADKAADDAWCTLKSREEYDACRAKLREKMIDAIGGLESPRRSWGDAPCQIDGGRAGSPLPAEKLNAKVMDRISRDGYRIEKILFESRPGVYVTGLLFLPDEAKHKPPYKAILLPCGHSANGKGSDVYQRGAVMGAMSGFAVFIYDPFAQGERSVGNGHDACSQHNRYGALAALLGQSMARQRIRDGMRAIDYLLSREDVMKDGVGCMGNSGGGTMTALLEALDPRVVAACPSCYISSLRTVVPSTSGKNISQIGDAEQNVFGQLSFGLNHAGYVLLGANAVRMHCCHRDFFPISGSRETYAVVQEVVRNCGLDARRYGMTDVAGRHGWKESLRASSVQWMHRWLAGDETVPEIDVAAMRKLDEGFDIAKVDHGLDGRNCNVTPDGRVDKLPGFKSIFDCLKDDLAAVEKRRVWDAEAVVKRAGIRPLDRIGASVKEIAAPQRLPDGFTILREVYSFGDGQKVPAVTFLPKGAAKGAVLVVDDRADRGIHRMRVTQTLAEGKAITVADLAGIGETGAMYRKTWQGTDTPDEVPATMLYMLGKSMVGVRAEEMIALADAQMRRLGLKTEIVAHGNAAIAASHAYAARRDLFAGISCCHTPPGWADSVRKGTFIPFANVVNGALLDYDWPDLLRAGTLHTAMR